MTIPCTAAEVNAIYPRRPRFAGPADYIRHVRQARALGRDPWPPTTREEFVVIADEFPDLARRYRPPTESLRILHLPDHYGQPVEPLPELWQERFLITLRDDPDFRAAVRAVLEVR